MPDNATRQVALLRGVNVGGGNKLPMAALRALATELGWRDGATYIASGNLVFTAEGGEAALAEALRQGIHQRFGLDIPVIVRDGDAMRAAVAACPYAPEDERRVHVFFLFGEPAPDLALLESVKTPDEDLTIGERTAWLHTPGGYGRSKLAEKALKVLGCDATARNLRTARKLVEMLG